MSKWILSAEGIREIRRVCSQGGPFFRKIKTKVGEKHYQSNPLPDGQLPTPKQIELAGKTYWSAWRKIRDKSHGVDGDVRTIFLDAINELKIKIQDEPPTYLELISGKHTTEILLEQEQEDGDDDEADEEPEQDDEALEDDCSNTNATSPEIACSPKTSTQSTDKPSGTQPDTPPKPPSPGDDSQSSPVYGQVATAIDELLAQHPRVRPFLKEHCSGAFLPAERDNLVVADSYRHGQGNVSHVLKQIRDHIPEVGDWDAYEWSGLWKLVGRLVTLGVDPNTIAELRPSLKNGRIQYPSEVRTISFSSGELSHTADFPPVLIAALAQGLLRLNRVFEKETDYREKRVPPALVGKGPTPPDKEWDLMYALVRTFQNHSDIPENPTKDELKVLLRQVRSDLSIAATEDHEPFYTLDQGFLAVADMLLNDDFGMHDFWLLSSTDEKLPSEMITSVNDATRLFRYALNIHEAIKPYLPLSKS